MVENESGLTQIIDKRGGRAWKHTYCTLTVIGIFSSTIFTWEKYVTLSYSSRHYWYGCVACVLTITMSCLNSAKL